MATNLVSRALCGPRCNSRYPNRQKPSFGGNDEVQRNAPADSTESRRGYTWRAGAVASGYLPEKVWLILFVPNHRSIFRFVHLTRRRPISKRGHYQGRRNWNATTRRVFPRGSLRLRQRIVAAFVKAEDCVTVEAFVPDFHRGTERP